MNWLSHWDEDLDENFELVTKLATKLDTFDYKVPTEEEINTLFGCDNAIECVCKVEAQKTDNLIRCPHCSESYYIENYSECTAVYYPPIYKDGVNINPDRNTTTTHYTCMNCGKKFSYSR